MTLVNKTFSQLITFTRASSATFVGSNGLIQTATTNTPRFDYDPVTLAAKGLLIEEQRANLLRYSEQFDNAAWVKASSGTGSVPVVTPNVAVAPDGTTTADSIVFDRGAGNAIGDRSYILQAPTVTTAAYTQSIWLKAATVGDVGKQLALRNVAGGSYGVVTLTTDWVLHTRTETGFTGNWELVNRGTITADNTVTALVWGAQLEAGSFATSYIPTVASQVTRSADVASVNTLSPWFNATEGTLYAEGSALAVSQSSDRTLVSLSTGTAANTVEIYKGASTSNAVFYITNSSVLQAGLSIASTFLADVPAKSAGAYKTDDIAFATKGATPLTDSLAVIPTMDRLGIGSRGSGSPSSVIWNGHIRRITYYKRRLSNADLQSITL